MADHDLSDGSEMTGPIDDAFLNAAALVRKTPQSAEAWDELDDYAASSQRPDQVGALYREMLGAELAPEIAATLGRRAVEFHEEWFREDSPALIEVLSRVLQVDPSAEEWAFPRLTVAFTVAERWEELLDLYDRAIEATDDQTRRAVLLEEAAQTAKDFAGNPNRSIGYLQQLIPLRPGDKPLAGSLERLLERQERFEDLIAFWRTRLSSMARTDARRTCLRMAQLWVEPLGRPAEAIGEIRVLFSDEAAEPNEIAEGCSLLEQILADESVAGGPRRQALSLLRRRYSSDERSTDMVRTLDAALEFADHDERVALHQEAATRLETDGDPSGAMDHYASLLRLTPASSTVRGRLRMLAEQTGEHQRRAQALVSSADACDDPVARATLRMEAAEVFERALDDVTAAIGQCVLVVEERTIDPAVSLTAARRLSGLYRAAGRNNDELTTLEHLAELETDAVEQRRVRGQAARLAAELGQFDRAIAIWEKRISNHERDSEALDALVSLLEAEQRWEPLVAALRTRIDSAMSNWQRRADLVRIAKVQTEELSEPADAIATWREVAAVHGEDIETVDALAALYASMSRWQEFGELLSGAATREDAHLANIRCALGDAFREHLGDPQRAFVEYKRALEAEPRNEQVRAGLATLCDLPRAEHRELIASAVESLARSYSESDEWEPLLALLHQRLSSAPDRAARARLLKEAAEIQERRPEAPRAALESVRRAFLIVPGDTALEAELVRLGEAISEHEHVATAFEEAARSISDDPDRKAHLYKRAGEVRETHLEDHAGAADAYAQALAHRRADESLASALVRTATLAERFDVAEQALLEVVSDANVPAGHIRALAQVQRHNPGESLFRTLLRLSEAHAGDLDALTEAAAFALDTLSDPDRARPVLEKLYERAAALWRRGTQAQGERSAEEACAWSLDQLVALCQQSGDFARVVALLRDGASLPFDRDRIVELKAKAATVAVEHLEDRQQAIELYREVLILMPSHARSIATLAELYETEDEITGLLALRKRELGLTADRERRLELRLEIARLISEIETRGGGRAQALRDNLAEHPGHAPSLAALTNVLSSHGRYGELAELLSSQADETEGEDAAALWYRTAELAETHLHEIDRALEAYRRSVDLSPRAEALDALARIHRDRKEFAAASRWLERRLELAGEPEHGEVSLTLAHALFDAGRPERAAQVLEAARVRDPANSELQDLLADHYRKAKEWSPLAQLLTEASAQHHDADKVLAMVREAAKLYHDVLSTPADSVGVLRRGLEFAPEDRGLRMQLAEGLRFSGELEEAWQVLSGLVEDFGRRRSGERAEVHYRLGIVAHARGELQSALEQLELATKMAMTDPEMLHMLARLSREAGQLDRAEKAYRALLMLVRRRGRDQPLLVGVAEVMYELSAIARDHDDREQATELFESALETAAQSDDEAVRLTEALTARQEAERALSVLQRRLETTKGTPTSPVVSIAMVEVLSGQLGRDAEALDHGLAALSHAAESDELHRRVLELAKNTSRESDYRERLEQLLEQVRHRDEPTLISSLLLRLGQVLEVDLEDLAAAKERYAEAEQLKVDVVAAWRNLARVAGRMGDTAEHRRVLRQLVEVSELDLVDRAEALYQLADVLLKDADEYSEGAIIARRAFDADPQPDRLGTVLSRALSATPQHDALMALYEEVARASGSDDMLLDFFERRAARSDVSMAQLREAVDKARAMGAGERVARLLERAVDRASSDESTEAPLDARWAMLALADRHEAAGEIVQAVEWARRAAEATEAPAERRRLEIRVAQLASQPGGDLTLAAEAYERLRETDAADPEIWKPLLRVYRESASEDKLSDLVNDLVDTLLDPEQRNVARLEKVKFLLDHEGREHDAVDILKQVLDEEPDHQEASQCLASIYEQSGYDEDLVELLGRQLDAARDRQDLEAIQSLTLRLGGLLETVRREEAIDLYRRAFDWIPADREVAGALLALIRPEDDPREWTETRERLLATATGEEASQLATEICAEWQALDDPEGMQRALELGCAGNPSDASLRERLETSYREREDWSGLANYLLNYAEQMGSNVDEQVARLREAAELFQHRLGDPAGAVQVMRRILEITGDESMLSALVEALHAAGDNEGAVAEVSRALDDYTDPDERFVELLKLRAQLYQSSDETVLAVRDYEQAYELMPHLVTEDLASALRARADRAAQDGEREAQRAAMMRLVTVLSQARDSAGARQVLVDWLAVASEDVEALLALREIDVVTEHWSGVAETCNALVRLQHDHEQMESALLLADACAAAGEAAGARTGLEVACRDQPGNAELSDRLMKLYEDLGAYREVAEMLTQMAAQATEDHRAPLYLRAGQLFVESVGDAEAAIEPLQAALTLQPEDNQIKLLLADALTASRHIAEAGKLLEEAISNFPKRRSPELSQLQHRMARLARMVEDRDVEQQWLQAALDSDKNNVAAAGELARLAMDLGQYDAALGALRVVTLSRDEGPMSRAMAFLLQAQIAQHRGESRRALLWARKAHSEDPTLTEAEDFLRELGEV